MRLSSKKRQVKQMKCEKCGEELTLEDQFCTNCGERITPEQELARKNKLAESQNQQPEIQHGWNGQITNPNQATFTQPVEDQKVPNRLCTISLLLRFAVPIVCGLVATLVSYISKSFGKTITTILELLVTPSSLAAFVLMIYVRVKYPSNTFGKVLMWLYIISLILYVIIFVLIVAACISCIEAVGH